MATHKNKEETKHRILEAAKKLFAEKGFDLVTLREITKTADVNVAAVNYHFSNKENLIDEVIIAHMLPVMEERMRLLSKAKSKAAELGKAVSLDQILDAFMRPFICVMRENDESLDLFRILSGRCISDKGDQLPERIKNEIAETIQAFTQALSETLPELESEELLWRLHFTFGVTAHTLMYEKRLFDMSRGASGTPSFETTIERMVTFCKAGLLAEKGEKDV